MFLPAMHVNDIPYVVLRVCGCHFSCIPCIGSNLAAWDERERENDSSMMMPHDERIVVFVRTGGCRRRSCPSTWDEVFCQFAGVSCGGLFSFA